MKLSNFGLWFTAAFIAWAGWMALDMGASSSGTGAGQGMASASFAEVEASAVPVLVEFYADWCGPCRAVAPVLDDLRQELEGRARVVKFNVDHESGLAARFKVRSIPTFIAFKDGRETARQSGAIGKQQMKAMLGL